MPTASVGVILSAVPLGVSGQPCPERLPVPISAGRPQSSLPHLPPNRIASHSPSLPTKRVEAATVSARSTGRVVPEVAGIIERVLVPALVSKYIAQLISNGKHS